MAAHTHNCQCGDYRVCNKGYCTPGTPAHLDAWVCPDCDLDQKLEALQRVELARINQLNTVLDKVFPSWDEIDASVKAGDKQ